MKTYQVTIPATKPGGDDVTRALYLDGSALKTRWGDGEKVFVYKNDVDYVGYLTPATLGSTQTKLTGSITGEFTTSDKLTLYYLKPKAAVGADYTGTRYYGDYTGQTGSRDDIGANYDFMKAADVAITAVGPTSMLTSNGGDNSDNILKTADATFVREQAITKFTVNRKNSGIPLAAFNITSTTPLTISATSLDLTITPTSDISEVWVAMPGSAMKTYKFESTADSKKYGKSKDVALVNNKYYTATLTMGRDIQKISVTGIPAADGSQTYSGSAVNVGTVTSGDDSPEPMTSSDDYSVSYKKWNTSANDWDDCAAADVKGAGKYKAIVAGTGDYEGTYESEFTITKAPAPNITVGTGVDGVVLSPAGTQSIDASALGASGSDFTYSVSPASGVVSVSADGTITAVGGGTATVTISLPDDDNHAGNTKDITVYVKEGIGGSLPDPGEDTTPGSGWD